MTDVFPTIPSGYQQPPRAPIRSEQPPPGTPLTPEAGGTSKKIKEYAVVVFAVLATLFAAATVPLFISYCFYETPFSYVKDSLFASITCFVMGSYLETPAAAQPPPFNPYIQGSSGTAATTYIPPPPPPPPTGPPLIGKGPGIVNGGNTCFITACWHALMGSPFEAAIEASYPVNFATPSVNAFVQTALQKYRASKQSNAACIPGTPWKWGLFSGETPFTLNPLRVLSPDARADWVMGDADEMIDYLLSPVNTAAYPRLFFSMTIERRVEEFNLRSVKNRDQRVGIAFSFWKNKAKITKKMKEDGGMNVVRARQTLIPPDRTIRKVEPYCKIHVSIPPEGGKTGQQLLDALFEWQPNPEHDLVVGIDGIDTEAPQVKLFKVDQERVQIDAAPDQFFFVLKRFKYERGYRSKITTAVSMQDVITLKGAQYDLKKIIIHEGVHYWDLISHENGWGRYDDANVYRAPERSIEYAHNYGYIYYYVKRSDAAV